jgi:hypothetical protein
MSVTIRTCGGLGNQLAQRAFGYLLETFGNEVIFERSWFNCDTRAWVLDRFNTEVNIGPVRGQCIQEGNLLYHPEFLKKYEQDVTLIGYWQAHQYRSPVEDTLRKAFTLRRYPSEKSLAIAREIENSNSVFLHVRRTDSLSGRGLINHGVCPQSYYQRAMSYVSTRVPAPHFFIFSDDIEWCKQNIQVFGYPATFVDHNSTGVTEDSEHEVRKTDNGTEHEDFWLMTRCKHSILANSSFSMWAGYLNANPEKIVVGPKQWFVSTSPHDSTDICSPDWIRL